MPVPPVTVSRVCAPRSPSSARTAGESATDPTVPPCRCVPGQTAPARPPRPARVRGGIDESSVGGPRLLPRLGPSDVRVAENSRQRRCRGNRGHSQVAHLLVDADRPVIQPGLLQCGADPDRLLLDVLGDPVRARPGPSAARLKSRGLPLLERPSPDRVEGLPRRWRARGRTCSPRPAAHPVATARSRDGHEDQPGRSGPRLKHRGEVSPPKGPEAAPIY